MRLPLPSGKTMSYRMEFEKVLKYCEGKDGLNIGCGNTVIKNSFGVDMDPKKKGCVIVANAWQLPIADNSIGYIVSMACIEHLDRSLQTVLKEWRRVLKTGGRCIVTTPEGSVTKNDWVLAQCSDHLNLFTLPQLTLHFEVAGFEIEVAEEIDRMPESPHPTIIVVGKKNG